MTPLGSDRALRWRWLPIALLALLIGGCHAPAPATGPDLGALADAGAADQSVALVSVLPCRADFGGFAGASAVARQVECPCGCNLPMAGGFYLQGDVDLQVDYRLTATPPAGLDARLSAVTAMGLPYAIARDAGTYVATLPGLPPASVAAPGSSGTLELARVGYVWRALADGAQLASYVGGSGDPLAVALAVELPGCDQDGGASDGGACGDAPIEWSGLRLVRGTLVDRR